MNPATIDLADAPVRTLHETLHALGPDTNQTLWHVINPRGRHSVSVGLDAPITVRIKGHVGYYCAGMNARAKIVIEGNAGPGVAENMMSGEVWVQGDASQAAGSSGRGGLLSIDGNAGARCGISMKGIDIVVGGSVGHMSAFMGQRGTLVVCGDAGESLGDSIYEAKIFVRGSVASLGADCEEQQMTTDDAAALDDLLRRAGHADLGAKMFRLYASARRLYHFHVDNAAAY